MTRIKVLSLNVRGLRNQINGERYSRISRDRKRIFIVCRNPILRKVTKEFGGQNGEAQFSFLMERNMLEVSVYYKSPTLVSDLNLYQQIPEGD